MDSNHKMIWEIEQWPRFTWQKRILPPILREIHQLQGQLIGLASVFPPKDLARIRFDAQVERVLHRFEATEDPAFQIECQTAVALETDYRSRGINRKYPVSDRVKYQAMLEVDHQPELVDDFNKFRLIQWYKWIKDSESEQIQPEQPRLRKLPEANRAIPRDRLGMELSIFINWFNQTRTSVAIDPAIRAALTYLWLSLIKPFESYNPFLALRMAELSFTQTNGPLDNLVNLMAELENESSDPKPMAPLSEALQTASAGDLDLTQWILWFLGVYKRSLIKATDRLNWYLHKERFWMKHHATPINKNQRLVLEELLTDHAGKYPWGISASDYMKITRVSKATATRHLSDLTQKKCLKRRAAGGRSTKYQIATI